MGGTISNQYWSDVTIGLYLWNVNPMGPSLPAVFTKTNQSVSKIPLLVTKVGTTPQNVTIYRVSSGFNLTIDNSKYSVSFSITPPYDSTHYKIQVNGFTVSDANGNVIPNSYAQIALTNILSPSVDYLPPFTCGIPLSMNVNSLTVATRYNNKDFVGSIVGGTNCNLSLLDGKCTVSAVAPVVIYDRYTGVQNGNVAVYEDFTPISGSMITETLPTYVNSNVNGGVMTVGLSDAVNMNVSYHHNLYSWTVSSDCPPDTTAITSQTCHLSRLNPTDITTLPTHFQSTTVNWTAPQYV